MNVGEFCKLTLAGLTPGQTNVVQTTTNLTQWSALSTNIAAASALTITNTLNPGMRLFRVVEWSKAGG